MTTFSSSSRLYIDKRLYNTAYIDIRQYNVCLFLNEYMTDCIQKACDFTAAGFFN
jgi:hypothetical protein